MAFPRNGFVSVALEPQILLNREDSDHDESCFSASTLVELVGLRSDFLYKSIEFEKIHQRHVKEVETIPKLRYRVATTAFVRRGSSFNHRVKKTFVPTSKGNMVSM